MSSLIKAPLLKKGDAIGAISSSAPLAGLLPHRFKNGVIMLKKMGFTVRVGSNALKITDYTAGTPKERAKDINDFFKDKKIKAIFSFIGGNHSNQILKYLDFDLIKKNPKIFIGYSDSTVLHFALHTKANLISFYGPAILTQFAENPAILTYTKNYLEKAIMSFQPIGKVIPASQWTDEVLDWFNKEDLKRPRKLKKNDGWQWLKNGEATGPILGGCLSSIIHLRGTNYWPDFSNSILFWEIPESKGDFRKGEDVDSVDAYLTDLELSGILKQIKGMIIGRPFAYTSEQIKKLITLVKDKLKEYDFPVLFNVDIGHTDPMITVPLGVKIRIN